MIKLFSVKDKQKKDAAAAAAGRPKQSAGELRMQKGGPHAPTPRLGTMLWDTKDPRVERGRA